MWETRIIRRYIAAVGGPKPPFSSSQLHFSGILYPEQALALQIVTCDMTLVGEAR